MECKICGFIGKSLTSHIIRKHDVAISEYKLKYKVDRVQEMSEIQKKNLSELWKDRFKTKEWSGKYDKNRTSIWKIDYWVKLGYTENEAKLKISELQSKNSKARDYKKSPSTLTAQFWINNGLDEQSAELKITVIQKKLSKYSSKFTGKTHSKKSKLKTSNTMRNYIDDFGFTKWARHFGDLADLKYRSESEVEIFNYVSNELKYSAIANEFISDYNVDIIVGNKIIEYFGTYWHAHIELFNENDIHPTIKKTAGEIRKYDEIKLKKLKELGYDVLVIWETDYNANKEYIKSVIKEYLQ